MYTYITYIYTYIFSTIKTGNKFCKCQEVCMGGIGGMKENVENVII